MPEAITYWRRAGRRALERSAYTEATSHLTKGLELLKTLPDTPARVQQELTLQVTLGPVLIATKGYGAPEVEKTYARAQKLCQQVGETPHLFSVLLGLRIFYLQRGELETALELGQQLLRLAQYQQDPALLVPAYHSLGAALLWLGEVKAAREQLEWGIALYNPQQHSPLLLRSAQDYGVTLLCYAAMALWALGYPDRALERIHEAITLAHKVAHPLSLAYAQFTAAAIHQYRREAQAAQKWAETVIALSSEQGFSQLLAFGIILRAWTLAGQGQEEEGMTQLRQGLITWQATGAKLGLPWWLALLAEVHGKVGQSGEGLGVLTEALAAVHKTGERYYEAELYRLKGTLTLRSQVQGPKSKVEEAEECFHKAIEIARRQQAKSLELRAVMSLSRLWQQQGKRDEARQILAEIDGWFTEGFDTKDLQEAEALLEELS
jgi:predicted ATPase